MGRKNYTGQTKEEQDFIQNFSQLSQHHNPWTVWKDFIHIFACTLSNRVDHTETHWNSREESCLSIAKGYPAQDLKYLVSLTATTTEALITNPAQDFLGTLYMNLNFGSDWHGQYFTPWGVSKAIAQITLGEDILYKIREQGFVSICDYCCGAGCLLMAAANVCQTRHIDYPHGVLFMGQDIDPIVAKMCYIQLSLLGCAGYVIIGNSLTNTIGGDVLHPIITPESDIWYTPMWFSPLWSFRRNSHMPYSNI